MGQTVGTNLTDVFADRLRKVGNMIILLDTYDSPLYTTRVWCIFEVYTSTVCNIHVDVTLPEASKVEFYKKLTQGDFSGIAASLTSIDAESAVASYHADEDAIKSLIQRTTGFNVVNETVKSALTKWLASAFEGCLQANAISEVGRIVFKLIVPSEAAFFALGDWIRASRQHIGLAEFLEVSGDEPDVAFAAMDQNRNGAVTMLEMERYLQSKDKTIIVLSEWLTMFAEADPKLKGIRQGLEVDLLEKVRQLREQLQKSRNHVLALGLEMPPQTLSHAASKSPPKDVQIL